MSAIVVQPTRDAVVTTLNGASLTPIATATAVYDYWFGLEDLAGGRIVVAPRRKANQILTRGSIEKYELTIDVVVQYKFTTPSPSELDPYMNLAETIGGLFLGKQLSTGAVCLKVEVPHLFFEEHMKKPRVFTSIVSPVFTCNQ